MRFNSLFDDEEDTIIWAVLTFTVIVAIGAILYLHKDREEYLAKQTAEIETVKPILDNAIAKKEGFSLSSDKLVVHYITTNNIQKSIPLTSNMYTYVQTELKRLKELEEKGGTVEGQIEEALNLLNQAKSKEH